MNQDKIVQKFTNNIRKKSGNLIEKIIFFGSRVKGTAKPWSDYDFLIVVKEKNRDLKDNLYDVVMDFLLMYGVDISLKIYSLKRFKESLSYENPFLINVLKTGRNL